MSFAQFETRNLGGIRVHVCSSEKFKTSVFTFFLQQELSRDTVTKTAILPHILQRGTSSYPTTIELRRRLNDMYGATLFGDVFKQGERHIMHLGLDLANDRYIQSENSLLQQGISFLCEVLTQPYLDNQSFRSSYVDSEKRNLKQRIEQIQDDKMRYASVRTIESMCQDEPFSLLNQGRLEEIPALNGENLFTYYQEWLSSCPIDFFCVGNVSVDELVEQLAQALPQELINAQRPGLSSTQVHHTVQEVKEVVDQLDVKQGKLNLGLRTHTTMRDEDYPALLMFNGILGGFPHSKLFMNVREKASLAYYCSSRVEPLKGLLFIQSGIEISNYDQAVQIIQEQLAALKQGQISEQEIAQTKATLSNQLREQQDHAFMMIHSRYQSVLSGKTRSTEEMLDRIQDVTKEQIEQVAQKVQLDTIYFLRNKEV